MPKLVLHTGFHKTGTTSVQKLLRKHKKRLSPYVIVLLREDIDLLCEAARLFSVNRTEETLTEFKNLATVVFASFDPTDPRDICISSEDLSGHMPGRLGLTDYSAAIELMAALEEAFMQSAICDHELSIIFTTRSTKAWATSCYSQHLRATRLTATLEEYLDRPEAKCDLAATVEAVQSQLKTLCVAHASLEEFKHARLGPAEAILGEFTSAQKLVAKLKPLGVANASLTPDLLHEFRRLNASTLTSKELSEAKGALHKAHTAKMKNT